MENSFNKSDLVKSFGETFSLTNEKARELVDGLLDIVVKKLKEGTKVNISGFGAFEAKLMKPRLGVNPKTGEKIQIASRRVLKFRVAKNLKEDLSPTAPPVEPVVAPAPAA